MEDALTQRAFAFALTILLVVSIGCDPIKPSANNGPSNSTAGDPAAAAPQKNPDLNANSILKGVIQRYQSATSYQDKGVLYLSYSLNGKRLEEPKRWATKFSNDGRLAYQAFNANIRANGKTLSCEVFDIGTENLDNQKLIIPYTQPGIAGIPLLTLYRDSIARHFVAGFSEMPLEEKYESNGPLLIPPAVSLLTSSASRPAAKITNPWIQSPEQTERMNDQTAESVPCYVVRSLANGLTADIWVSQADATVVQISLPLKLLADEVVTSPEVQEVVLMAKFHEATFDGPVDEAAFVFAPKADARPVQKYVSLPEPLPSDLIGRTAPRFQLQTPTGQTRDRLFFDGKTTVLVWLSGTKSIKTAEKLKDVFAGIDRTEFNLAIVYSDSDTADPGSGHPTPSSALQDLSGRVDAALLYDQQHSVSSRLEIKAVPAAVVLDGEAKIQFVQNLVGEAWVSDLKGAIERVDQGDDLAADMKDSYASYLDTYHQQLNTVSAEHLLGRPQKQVGDSAGKRGTLRIQPTKAWTCRDFKQPGNAIALPDQHASGARFAVFDGWQTIGLVDSNGKLLGRKKLDLAANETATMLRSIDGAGGKTKFAIYSILGDRVHWLDDQFQTLGSFPQKGSQSKTLDVHFDSTNSQNTPTLLLAFQDGRMSIVDCSTGMDVAIGEKLSVSTGEQPVSSILTFANRTIAVVNGGIKDVASGRKLASAENNFNRLATTGKQLLATGKNKQGNWSAIGFDESMQQLWSIQTGPQLFENPLEPIASAAVPNGEIVWAVADSKQMIHLVTGSGQWLGEFESEQEITGISMAHEDGKLLLILCSKAGIDCWDLNLQ